MLKSRRLWDSVFSPEVVVLQILTGQPAALKGALNAQPQSSRASACETVLRVLFAGDSRPHASIQRPIPNWLGDILRLDIIMSFKISDRPRYAQNLVVRAGG